VEAPVSAEDQQEALVFAGRFRLGFLDLGVGIGVDRINFLLHVGGLLEAGSIGSFGGRELPLISLLEPDVIVGNGGGVPVGQAGDDIGAENDVGDLGTRRGA